MDYQVFLVRPPGSTTISGRHTKGASRILRVSDTGITVSPLSSFNAPAAEYAFERMGRVFPSHEDSTELTVEMFDGARGHESIRFCCDSRTALLTALLNKMDDMNGIGVDFPLMKHSHERGGLAETVLRIRSASIVKMLNTGLRHELRKVNPAKKINFEDIVRVETLVDDEHIVLVHLKSHVMRLSFKDSVPFLQAVHRNMKTYLDLDVEIERVTTPVMVENISARLRTVKESPVLFEFHVSKRMKAMGEQRSRTIAITNDFFIEKCGEEVLGIHSLNDVVGLTVDDLDPTEVTVEFKSWRPTQYYLEERDDFLASMADIMGAGKGGWFSLRMEPLYPYCFPEKLHPMFKNECETYYLNRIIGSYYGSRDPDVLHVSLKEYAANIHVGDSQCADPKIAQAVADVLKDCLADLGRDAICATTCCIVLQRLLASRACFDATKSLSDVLAVLFQCLHSDNSVLSYLASVALRTCFKLPGEIGSAETASVSKQEVANKLAVLSAENLQHLIALLHTRSLGQNNALQVFGLLEVFSVALQSHPSDSELARTWMKAFESAILVAADIICSIFWCPSFVVFQSNSTLLISLLSKTSSLMSSQLQKICLGRCVLLIHLRSAIFSEKKHLRLLSGNLVYLMLEGSRECRKLLEAILPKGVMRLYAIKAFEMSAAEKEKSSSRLPAWMETLEILQRDNLETPVLVWNDKKRMELRKFLREELDAYETALAGNRDLLYNSADVHLVYSAESEGEGSVVGGVHLELLVDHQPPAGGLNDLFWKLRDPLSIFQSVFQAMVLGFTPLFGHNNLPEIDLRLAAHALSWIYNRHADEVTYCLETLNVIEAAVGMLREIIETEHEVFVFKLVVFLLAIVESGGRDNVVRFVRAGGATVLVPLITLSLAKCCKDRNSFESDGWKKDDIKLRGAVETIQYVGSNGEVRFIRVPSGRAHEVLERAVLDGSLDAKEAIKWQDEKVPPKVLLGISLDLVEALLRFSGSDSQVMVFPPSAACLNFSREEILCHLVQALLRAKSPVFGRILDIITYLVKTNKSAMSRLYKLGAFEILLWKLLAGVIVDSERLAIVKFLLQCHLLQDPDSIWHGKDNEEDHPPWRDSALQLYLPEGMITKLMSEGPDSFTSILDTEQNFPEVIWSLEMRERLLEYLVAELGPYVKFRASDPMALYIHVPKPPLAYPELEGSVFAAPYYLQNLLDTEQFPSYQINDPVGFLSNLMLELRKLASLLGSTGSPGSSWSSELPRLHLLLHAQAYVLERFPQLPLPSDVEAVVLTLATPALKSCVGQKDDTPMVLIDILQHTTKILRRYCAATSRDESAPKATLNFALSVLSLGTKLSNDERFPDSSSNASLESAMAGSFFVLEQASSTRAGRGLIFHDIRWRMGFWWALCSAAGDAAEVPPKGPSPVSFAALGCLKNFANDEEYSDRILKQALYLPLLLLAIPPEDTGDRARDSKSALLYSAADVLGCLVRALFIAGGENPTSRQLAGRSVMSRIIPEPLLASLHEADGSEKFLSLVTTNIEQPMAIWTGQVRSEIRARITERLFQHNAFLAEGAGETGDDLDWLADFNLDCLKEELVVGGLYVKGLASGQWESFELPAGHTFLDSMQEYLEAHQNAVVLDSENVASTEDEGHTEGADSVVQDGAVAKYLTVLAALKECLKYAIKAGREDLISHFRHDILSQLQLMKRTVPQAQMEFASIIKVLVGHEKARDIIMQSDLVSALTMQLWEATAGNRKGSLEGVVVATADAFLLLSESIPATVSATNLFASTGVLLPLLALFCGVGLPSLRESSSFQPFVPEISPFCRFLSAQILGQLLLAASGVSRRVKLLNDLAQRKSFGHSSSNGRVGLDDSMEAATDMYELMDVMEPGSQREEPLVIKTLLLLLPVDLLSTLTRDPSEACSMFDKNYLSPRFVWDEDTRQRVKSTLEKEALKTAFLQKGLYGIPSWSLVRKRPVFLRWVLVTVSEDEQRPLFRDEEEDGYARELYLGGFYVDQFLRNPQYDFGSVLEERFMREIRKAVVIGVPTDGIHSDEFDIDDRRRLLLVLLLLFKGRPALLSGYSSNIDIFLPLQDFISGGVGSERRALAQPAMLLFHCTAKHKDIVDCVISEELIYTLSSFLCLHVPQTDAGNAGTDPRLCSLMLLLRLMRLSHKTVEIAYKLGLVSKIADIVLNIEGSVVLRQRAAECLAIMCADKRRGQDVSKLLDKLIPESAKGYGVWNIQPANIRDEVIDSRTLKHFLQHRYPSGWWVLDTPEGTSETDTDPTGPVTIVEATLTFPKAKMSDFNDEAEGVFRRSIATLARVEMRDVRILRKRTGSIIIDFEVYFQRSKHEHGKIREPEMDARAFKEKLESDSNQVFGTKFFGPMGVPMVTAIAIKVIPQLSRGKSWKKNTVLSQEGPGPTVQIVYVTGGQTPPLPRNGSEKDVNVIYVQGTQSPEEVLRASGVELGDKANFVLQQQPQIVYQLPPGVGGTGQAQVLYRSPSGFVPASHQPPCAYQHFSYPEAQLFVRSPVVVTSSPPAVVVTPSAVDATARTFRSPSLPSSQETAQSVAGKSLVSLATTTESPALPTATSSSTQVKQPPSYASLVQPSGVPQISLGIVGLTPTGFGPALPSNPSPLPPSSVASVRYQDIGGVEGKAPSTARSSPQLYTPLIPSVTGLRPIATPPPPPPPPPRPLPTEPAVAASNSLVRPVRRSPPTPPASAARLMIQSHPLPSLLPPVTGQPSEPAPSHWDKPASDAAPFPSLFEATLSGHSPVSRIMVRSEDERMVPLEKGLSLILEGADITEANREIAIRNFIEAFEEEPEELKRLIEKYPKLVQKYSLQPQLCCDLVVAWEEHCLDMLTESELAKHGRSIAAFDMCRFDDPIAATAEAKKKYQAIFKMRKEQEWKQRSRQLKGDMSAELTKAVSGRKEKLSPENAVDELKSLSTGKIKLKSKKSQSNLPMVFDSTAIVTQ